MASEGGLEGRFRLLAPGRSAREIRARSVTLGTHSSADFVLNDPLAAPLHARISRTADGFAIEDLGSSTGTFVGGLSAEGPTSLVDGARVVLGVTRVTAGISSEEGELLLCLSVEKEQFHFAFKTRDPEAIRSDPDEWTRSEVRFGRIPLVATLTWCALFVSLAAIVFLVATRSGERAFAPGPLAGTHAFLFASSAPDSVRERELWLAHAGAREAGCSACHTGRGAGALGLAGCAACHGEMLRAAHPFHDGPVAGPHARLADGDCALCHVGHGRADSAAALAFARGKAASISCERCHDAVERAPAPPLPAPELALRDYGFDPFSHAAHFAALPGIACETCHVPAAGGADFEPVSFRTCQGCHDGALAEAGMRQRLEAAGRLFEPAWHGSAGRGTEGGCLACHERVHDRALRSEPVARSAELFATWIPRGHDGHFEGRRCGECHAAPERLAGDGAPRASAFLHAVHLPRLDPEPGAEESESQRCFTCHEQVAGSDALSAERSLPPLDACRACHVDARGELTILGYEQRGPLRERTRPAFSHAQHARVEGGCFACHDFDFSNGPLTAFPRTRPEAAACISCHAGHENVAGGTCVACHPPHDEATRALFARGRPQRLRPLPAFPHFTPAHAALIENPSGCADCHPRDALDRSARVADLPSDLARYERCQSCHAQGEALFHWRR